MSSTLVLVTSQKSSQFPVELWLRFCFLHYHYQDFLIRSPPDSFACNHNSSEKKILNLNIAYGFSVVIIGLYCDDHSIKIDENDRNEWFFNIWVSYFMICVTFYVYCLCQHFIQCFCIRILENWIKFVPYPMGYIWK